MAWFAKRVVPLTRQAFTRLPEGQPSPLEPPAVESSAGITRIEFQDLDWSRNDILRSVEASRSQPGSLLPA